MLKYWGLYCFYSVMMGVLRKETILRKKMSVGGYGGFSDAMRCDDALLLACRGSDWGGVGSGEAARSWKRHSIVKGKGRVFVKGKAWKAESGFKKFNYVFFFFNKLCWCEKLWEFQKFQLYIYIYIYIY